LAGLGAIVSADTKRPAPDSQTELIGALLATNPETTFQPTTVASKDSNNQKT
jgi:hypothetical protein